MKYKETFLKVLTECCRLLVGVVFIFSGYVKAIDPVGFAIKITDYLVAFGLDMFQSLSLIISFNVIAIEFMLGVCLLLGAYRKYASLLALLLMSFMTPLTLYLALFEPVSDCGCFGDAVVLTNWQTFWKNVVLLAATIYLYLNNKRMYPFYTFKVIWFIPLFAYLFCVGFAFGNYRHLPILDFRPYKVGANIPELMSVPEGMPEDEYSYSFIYEKDGVRKTFALDEIPANDASWVFVDSKTELIKEGYRPVIESFNLYDEEDNDVTDEILTNPEGVFLLIAPRLEKANDEWVDEINSVYDYAQENDLLFYGVTGSGAEAVIRWSDYTGAEYPFLYADDTLLKTIIRSNPGLVLLRDGTVLHKWHFRDIPREEQTKEVMNTLLMPHAEVLPKEVRSMKANILTFIVPLLFVWIYDYFRNRRKKTASKIHNI